MVIAGPGTGKTSTIVERMLRLLEEDQARAVSFVTFTRTSRRDTRQRLAARFGEGVLDETAAILPRTSTLHAYAKSLVHRYGPTIDVPSSFSVLLEEKGEKTLVIGDTLEDLALAADVQSLAADIASLRSTGDWPAKPVLADPERSRFMQHYENLLVMYRALDMEAVVVRACQLLPLVASKLPPIFLQVDEYQDLNPSDQRLVALAASQAGSQVVVVGDDAQSIYGFRHADYDGLRQLWEAKEWEHTTFSDSARLPPHILNAALDLIQGEGYLGSRINRKRDEGRKVRVAQCTTSDVQIAFIAGEIRLAMAAAAETQHPLRLRDFLVLCPTGAFVDTTVNHLAQRYEIPAHKPTATEIPDDLWPLLLLLRILNSADPLALRQWLPILGFAADEVQSLRNRALAEGRPFFEVVHGTQDPRMEQFRLSLEMVRAAASDRESFEQALAGVPGLPAQGLFFEMIAPVAPNLHDPLPALGRLVQRVYTALGVLDPDEQVAPDDKVLAATLHSAKGLEAECVFCPWMNRRFMPMAGRDPAEERRVLYVGMTRAKQDLTLLFYEEFDASTNRRLYQEAMSPYLSAILPRLDVVRIRAADLR